MQSQTTERRNVDFRVDCSWLNHHFIAINEFKLELQSGNDQFGSKSAIFFVLCDLEIWWMTWKRQYGHLFYATASFVYHFIAMYEFKLELQSGNAQIGEKNRLYDLDLWPLTLTFCMNITFVNGNHSRKFHDNTMTGTLWKRCYRQTDGLTGRSVLRTAWSQLKWYDRC